MCWVLLDDIKLWKLVLPYMFYIEVHIFIKQTSHLRWGEPYPLKMPEPMKYTADTSKSLMSCTNDEIGKRIEPL